MKLRLLLLSLDCQRAEPWSPVCWALVANTLSLGRQYAEPWLPANGFMSILFRIVKKKSGKED